MHTQRGTARIDTRALGPRSRLFIHQSIQLPRLRKIGCSQKRTTAPIHIHRRRAIFMPSRGPRARGRAPSGGRHSESAPRVILLSRSPPRAAFHCARRYNGALWKTIAAREWICASRSALCVGARNDARSFSGEVWFWVFFGDVWFEWELAMTH